MNLAGGTPFATDNEFILDGKRYHLAADNRGQVALAIQRVSDQDVDAATPYSIPIHDFSRGSGFSFEGPDGTYDEADGWDLSTPGKAVTWPLLATGETLAGTDAKGWQFFLSGYLYVGRGRYVVKYEPDDTAGSEWPIIEIHDLGSGNVFGGRPALFKGKAYVPIRAGAFGTAQRFHQLTTVATHVVEEQTIVISGTPTGGTYTVTFDGKTSGNIAYNANQATVQAALRAIAGLELVTVVTTGSVPDYTHTVTMTGVAGAMGAASAPQMTSSAASLTGGAPAINHATTTAGTTDTWTQGPATYEATAFRAWRDRLARADSNTISLVSDDPMTGGDWGPEYSVGNSGEPITDLAVYGRMLIVAKTNGLYSFDEETTVTNETPDLEGIVDDGNCFPSATRVRLDSGVLAVSRRWYSGELVEISTAKGHNLAGTPNHPVLTDRGWVALNCLSESDRVRSDCIDVHDRFVESANPDVKHMNPTIGEIFDLAALFGDTYRRSGTAVDFHGDGQNSNVDVVVLDSQLRDRIQSILGKRFRDFRFVFTNEQSTELASLGASVLTFDRVNIAASRGLGAQDAIGSRLPLGRGHGGHPQRQRGIAVSQDASLSDNAADGALRYVQGAGDLVAAFPGSVPRDNGIFIPAPPQCSAGAASVDAVASEPPADRYLLNPRISSQNSDAFPASEPGDQVVSIRRIPFRGHVYNLETVNNRYFANGITAHNCMGLEMAQGYLLVPHKTGLIRWRPGAWEYVGAESEGGLEGAVSGGWGRVQGIAAAGRYTFLVTANPLDQTGTLLSLNPTGGRQTQALTPHMHQEEAAAYLEHVTVISRSTEPASPRTAGTLADDSAVGTITWTTPENADDSDDTYATAAVGTSHYLKATNYGFNIPTSATITGVRVSIERSATD